MAKELVKKWHELGPRAVQVVLDPDPEVCRLGFGDLSALQLLYNTAAEMGEQILQQQGLRVGVVITDETTTIYSPTARLIEAGGKPGERMNALKLDATILDSALDDSNLHQINLQSGPIQQTDVQCTEKDLAANPPLSFDVARKVRVFNARIEFVDFELASLSLSRKRVPIPSDLVGLAKDPKAQRLLRSSFQLIDERSAISGDRVMKLKQFIVKKYLITLPGYGTIIVRNNKEPFQIAVRALEKYVHRFQKQLQKRLQEEIDSNREVLAAALLPAVLRNPPTRWKRFLGERPREEEIALMLRSELKTAFGNADDVFQNMKVKTVFKGVTYESLTDPEFMRVAAGAIPVIDSLHEEFEAAKAKLAPDQEAMN